MPKNNKKKEELLGCVDFADRMFQYLTDDPSLTTSERAFMREHMHDCEVCESKALLSKELIIIFQENPDLYDNLPGEWVM